MIRANVIRAHVRRAAAAAVLALAVSTAAASAAGEWQPFGADSGAVCADGSAVGYLERIADPEKVVLYFEGGGACFSAATCAFDGEETSYISSSETTPDWLAQRGGIFDTSRVENPLAGYSFVYVPYCTGDAHLGNKATTYAPDLVVEHRGQPNGLVALDHLVQAFPDATDIVVAGSSAGSIPTPLFAGLATGAYPDARIVTLGDSSGAYPDEPLINAFVGSLWGSMEALPDWPEVDGISATEWSIPGLYRVSGAHAPDITFAKFDYAYDEVQAFYGSLVGVAADELVSLIDAIEADIEAAGVTVASFIAPGTSHTILGLDEFYELEVQGVRLVDWVGELVEGGTPADVHCIKCD